MTARMAAVNAAIVAEEEPSKGRLETRFAEVIDPEQSSARTPPSGQLS